MKSLILLQLAVGSAALGLILLLTPPSVPEAQIAAPSITVSEGKEVSLEYTLWLDEKTAVDSNVGGEPLHYVVGSGGLVPGVEKALIGMHVGERKSVTVPPEEGYGERVKDAYQEVSKDQIPADAMEVGTVLTGEAPNGQKFTVTIDQIKDDTVVLDTNHPLAGKTIYFSLRVLDIKVPEKP